MYGILSNQSEKLFEVIYKMLGQKQLKREERRWNELPGELKKLLGEAMNAGIPRDEAKYLLCSFGAVNLCLAEYADAANDFSAQYLVYGKELLYSFEN